MRITAELTRNGQWWAAEVREVSGVAARGRNLIDTLRMTCDAMVDATGSTPAVVQLVVSYPEAVASINAHLPQQRATSKANWANPAANPAGSQIQGQGQTSTGPGHSPH